MGRVRTCNSVNLKPGGIIELLVKVVNVLRMRPGFGVAHSDQQRLDMATTFARSALLSCLAKSALRFCALKDVKDFVYKWYPNLKVEVPPTFLLHVTGYSIFSRSSIILPGLWACILELHALTLAARSYALLPSSKHIQDCHACFDYHNAQ